MRNQRYSVTDTSCLQAEVVHFRRKDKEIFTYHNDCHYRNDRDPTHYCSNCTPVSYQYAFECVSNIVFLTILYNQTMKPLLLTLLLVCALTLPLHRTNALSPNDALIQQLLAQIALLQQQHSDGMIDGFKITGQNSLGRNIAGAGDMNNDGYDDLILGAFVYTDEFFVSSGAASVVYAWNVH